MVAAKLSVWDYIVFGVMLASSSVIGIYYGIKSRHKSTKEYLTAGGNMHWFPISLSIFASFFSAVGLMGVPAEVFTYGIQFYAHIIGFVLTMIISATIFAPVFYRNRITSANEYLQKRFTPGVRLLCCFLLILQYVLYLSVVLYAPSLALKAVAGVPLPLSLIVTGAVCTFYTTLGGMRAVIWTDVLQGTLMLTGMITVICFGVVEVGGFSNTLKIAERGDRLNLFDFNPDPTVRNTFWTLGIGGIFALMQNFTTSQVSVQRFISARSEKDVKKALYFNILYLVVFISLCSFAGLVMYAVFADCDPRKAGQILSNDQIIPYYVVTKLNHLKGVPGLYMACLLSGALSTASSGLNSLAAVTLEDLVKRKWPNISERAASIVTKFCAVAYGVLIVGLSFLVSSAGTMVIQLSISIFGMLASPQFGIFALGILVPRATSKGAYAGALAGAVLTSWLAIGALFYPPDKMPKPISIYKCALNSTGTNFTSWESGIVPYKYKGSDFPLAKFHSISYMYYSAFGIFITFFIGCLVTLCCSRGNPKEVDPILLFDYRSCLPNCCQSKKSYDMGDDAWELEEMVDEDDGHKA